MRTGNVTTRAGRFQQRSLFTSGELAPFKKNRWRYIRQRLARERERDEHPIGVPARPSADARD